MQLPDPVPGFNPNAGAPIPLAEAQQWAANYRDEPLTDVEKGGRKRINAYYLGNELLDRIQRQPGCVGLRFYMGVSKSKEVDSIAESQIVVVGVDKDGHDIVARLDVDGQAVYEDGIVGDSAERCPPMCDTTSPLS